MKIRNKQKLVYGIGVNDSIDPVSIKHNGIIAWVCPVYKAWERMLRRCYSDKCHLLQPTYSHCLVADDWLIFSNFRLWMMRQDWRGMEIDKDVLFPGNKCYSSEFCIFITKSLNLFITDHGAARGLYPIGVCLDMPSGKFISRCNNPFSRKTENLGRFTSSDLAHEAWRRRKHQHACTYADMQTDPRIAEALRTRYLPEKEII